MIDSGEHVTEPTKMIGFDLERARGLRDFLQDDCAEVGDVWAEMVAEIERLRLAYDTLRSSFLELNLLSSKKNIRIREQADRIQELEEALVESMAADIAFDEGHLWRRQEAYLKEARRQLQAEGKIGPDAKPRSWQITEERKAALGIVLETYTPDNRETIAVSRVLRDMLEEAGRE